MPHGIRNVGPHGFASIDALRMVQAYRKLQPRLKGAIDRCGGSYSMRAGRAGLDDLHVIGC
jgi:hypothetical protein